MGYLAPPKVGGAPITSYDEIGIPIQPIEQTPPGRNQHVQSLVCVASQSSHESHQWPLFILAQPRARGAAAGRVRRAKARIHAGVNDMKPLRVDSQVTDKIAAGPLRVGNYKSCRSQ